MQLHHLLKKFSLSPRCQYQCLQRCYSQQPAATRQQESEGSRRGHVKQKEGSDVWELSKYKYFYPCQSRWTDNDQLLHLNNGIFISWSTSLITNFLHRYIEPEETSVYTVKMSTSHRFPLVYPEVALAGFSVSQIGNSSILFKLAFFKPKSLAVDPTLNLGLTLAGDYASRLDMDAVSKQYGQTSATLAGLTTVLVDSKTEKPISELPAALKHDLNEILLE